MQRTIVAFKIPRRNSDRIHYARSVATAIAVNPHLPSPTPTLADFEAHIDAAAAASALVLIGPIGSAAQRDARFAAVQSDLEQLRTYVQRVADGSPGEARAIVESAGMSVKRPGLHDKPPLAVKAGLVSGSVVVVAKAAGDRATYGGSTQGSASRGSTCRPLDRRRRRSTDSSTGPCIGSGSAR
jgi:hypothetical protein